MKYSPREVFSSSVGFNGSSCGLRKHLILSEVEQYIQLKTVLRCRKCRSLVLNFLHLELSYESLLSSIIEKLYWLLSFLGVELSETSALSETKVPGLS